MKKLTAFLALVTFAAVVAGADKPNIVYILMDDLGYGDVSCLNPESKIMTPTLDRLATEGMIFTDAHSSSSVCTPSRYGILTGRYAWRTTKKQGVLNGVSPALIAPGRMTVASFLQEQGYQTACVGKWHLGLNWSKKKRSKIDYTVDIGGGPTDHGFDYFYGCSASWDMSPYVFIENKKTIVVPTAEAVGFGRKGVAAPGLTPEDAVPVFTEKACEWIASASAKDQPFFLYFSLTSPHTPVVPNDPFLGKSQAGEYGDFVIECDWAVEQVVQALKKAKIEKNTLLIVTSDNGPETGMIKRKKRHKHLSAGIYRGCKRDSWEGGHRVPFIARWPQTIKAGQRSEALICLSDLLATCADLVNGKLPDNAAEDSVSFKAALTGGTGREIIVHHSSLGKFSIRQGKWKLLLHEGSGGNRYKIDDKSPMQLYDLKADPSEKKNLYKSNPEIVQELKALMSRYVNEGRSTPGAKQKNDGPATWPQLDWMDE